MISILFLKIDCWFFQRMLKLLSVAQKCCPKRQYSRYISPCWLNVPEERKKHPIFNRNYLLLSTIQTPQIKPVRLISTSQVLAKETTFSKLKQMIRDYWYVIIPVEIITSIAWYGAIFLSLKSGVDIVQILTNVGVSEQTLRYLENCQL